MRKTILALIASLLFAFSGTVVFAQDVQEETRYQIDSQTAMEMQESINRYRSQSIEQAKIPPEDSDFSIDNRIARLKMYYDLSVEYTGACKEAMPTTLYYLESTCAALGNDFFAKMQSAFETLGVQRFYLKFHSDGEENSENYYGCTEFTADGELSVHIFTGVSQEANYFVLVHELGHVLNFALGDDNTEWEEVNGAYGDYTDETQYVSRYARYNSHEDFAEVFRVMMCSSPLKRIEGTVVDAKYILLYKQLFTLYGEESNVVKRAQRFLGL